MTYQTGTGEIVEGTKPDSTRFAEPASGSEAQDVADSRARERNERKAELAENIDYRINRSIVSMEKMAARSEAAHERLRAAQANEAETLRQERLKVEERAAAKRRAQEDRAAAEMRGQWSHVAEVDTAEGDAETRQQQAEGDAKMRAAHDPESKPKPSYDIDPALADPWDLPADKRVAQPQAEGFEKFRSYNGHEITPSDSLLMNSRIADGEVQAAANDVGIAARREGISQEGAQAFLDVVGLGYQPPKGESFDEDTAMRHMRLACGGKTEEVIADLKAWVGKRPAVAAFLDEGVGFGNHPVVLLTIGAIAQAAKGGLDITKPADAKVWAEKILNDPKSEYWSGSKLLVAGVQYALAVSESKKK